VYIWVLGCLLAGLLVVLSYMPFAQRPGLFADICYFALIGPLLISIVTAPFICIALH
jgi:hypothetical protein